MRASPTQSILDRLQFYKQSGERRWMARCPGHEDRGPSLSVRELGDGRVLLHCFSGCNTSDVLASIGLRMSDLFEKPLAQHLLPVKAGHSARELIELCAHEITVAALLAHQATEGPLSEGLLIRLASASSRIGYACGLLNDLR